MQLLAGKGSCFALQEIACIMRSCLHHKGYVRFGIANPEQRVQMLYALRKLPFRNIMLSPAATG